MSLRSAAALSADEPNEAVLVRRHKSRRLRNTTTARKLNVTIRDVCRQQSERVLGGVDVPLSRRLRKACKLVVVRRVPGVLQVDKDPRDSTKVARYIPDSCRTVGGPREELPDAVLDACVPRGTASRDCHGGALNDPSGGLLDVGVLNPPSGAETVVVDRYADRKDPQDSLGDDGVKQCVISSGNRPAMVGWRWPSATCSIPCERLGLDNQAIGTDRVAHEC